MGSFDLKMTFTRALLILACFIFVLTVIDDDDDTDEMANQTLSIMMLKDRS